MEVAIVLNSPKKIKNVKEDYVIYTDGGYKNKKYNKKKKTLALIGDFDTLKNIPKNENIIRLEKEKDFTDGERAILYAKEINADKITIYGAVGGRIEHILGNITLLKIAKENGIEAKIESEENTLFLASGKVEIITEKDNTLSIIPYTDSCEVSQSKGLFYPLNNLILTKKDTVGISNIATEDEVLFNVIKGEALVIIDKKNTK